MDRILVMDLLGGVVWSGGYARQVDLTPYAQGTYLIVVTDKLGRPLARARVVKL
jgi:hypothetical protein